MFNQLTCAIHNWVETEEVKNCPDCPPINRFSPKQSLSCEDFNKAISNSKTAKENLSARKKMISNNFAEVYKKLKP